MSMSLRSNPIIVSGGIFTSTSDKQKNLAKLANKLFFLEPLANEEPASAQQNRNLPITNSTLPPTAKSYLQQIFLTQQNASDNDLNLLCANKSHSRIANYFGASKLFTRSSINMVVIIYLHSLNKSGKSINEGFLKNGKLNIPKFYKFIEDTLNEDSLGKKIVGKLNSSSGIKYLEEVKLVTELSMINFGNYAVDISKFVTESKQIKGSIFIDKDNQDRISNKAIRAQFSEDDIIHAKHLALDYFDNLINDKLTKLDDAKQQQVKSQIIYLNNVVNLASRNLSQYKVNYAILENFADNIFKTLEINSQQEKIHFLNAIILINYHRNCGMNFKRALKAPVLIVWYGLPIIAFVGMVIAAVTALHVLGIALGIIGLIGAGSEGFADILNYKEHGKTLNSLNCGDKLVSTTNSYEQLIKKLDPNANTIRRLPDIEEMKEKFCSENNLSLTDSYISSVFEQLQDNTIKTQINEDSVRLDILDKTKSATEATNQVNLLQEKVTLLEQNQVQFSEMQKTLKDLLEATKQSSNT